MTFRNAFAAGLVAVAAGLGTATEGSAQTVVRVVEGTASSSVNVAMNRAIVLESDTPFDAISIANPNIADIDTLSSTTVYVLGKSPGRTTLTLLDPAGRLITNVDVRVAPDVAEFRERLSEILPGERIEVRTANDGIVLSGQVTGATTLARAVELAERYAPGRVTNLMTVGGTQQVMLKVRFAEMQRSVSKNLSASFGLTNQTGFEFGSQVFAQGNNLANQFDGNPATRVVSTNERAGVSTIGFQVGGLQFALLLEALETNGMVRTLAEPNLVAISGQSASFLAGGEYPIPVASRDGVSIEYKPFGVEMSFVPTVLEGDLINLELAAAVSGIDPTVTVQTNGISVNAFRRREANTVIEIRDGQSFAIAGLIQDDFTNRSGQVPWLGDIPIIGALFRSSDFQRNQSELVIIVTAHLVTPTRGEAFALPTDRVRPPTEAEQFLLGRMTGGQRLRGPAGEVAAQGIPGSFGYVME
ncbi:MAG: type II and III secretion system protein family protein [Rhodobacteraceae bacterium]|nr:type II and III secretion system protein family protein [Paracoccaceae bacterium]